MLNNIQALRAFAAINVVVFHIIGAAKLYNKPTEVMSILDGWGENGVDIFFVISGFVMLYAHAEKNISAVNFMKHRAQRILPIYWIATLLLVLLFLVSPVATNKSTPEIKHILASLFFCSEFFIGHPPVLYVGWTLEYEMLFYIIFAATISIKNLNIKIAATSIVLCAFILIFNTDLIVINFIFGMVVAATCLNKKILKWAAPFLIFGICFLLVSIVWKFEFNRIFIWGIPAALLVFGLACLPQSELKIFNYLGAASYSIYLMQVIAIPIGYKVLTKYFFGMNGDLIGLFVLLLSVVLGCFVFQYIEKPIFIYLKMAKNRKYYKK